MWVIATVLLFADTVALRVLLVSRDCLFGVVVFVFGGFTFGLDC